MLLRSPVPPKANGQKKLKCFLHSAQLYVFVLSNVKIVLHRMLNRSEHLLADSQLVFFQNITEGLTQANLFGLT
jgi:hypothetical protein